MADELFNQIKKVKQKKNDLHFMFKTTSSIIKQRE